MVEGLRGTTTCLEDSRLKGGLRWSRAERTGFEISSRHADRSLAFHFRNFDKGIRSRELVDSESGETVNRISPSRTKSLHPASEPPRHPSLQAYIGMGIGNARSGIPMVRETRQPENHRRHVTYRWSKPPRAAYR